LPHWRKGRAPTGNSLHRGTAFAGLSDDPKETNLARGLTQEIASALTNVPRILVIGGSSALTDKGKVVGTSAGWPRLGGVRYVLEGTVQQAGNPASHYCPSHRHYDRPVRLLRTVRTDLQEVFALQEDICDQSPDRPGSVDGTAPDKPLRVRGTQNLEAYLRVVQAREYQHRLRKESQPRPGDWLKKQSPWIPATQVPMRSPQPPSRTRYFSALPGAAGGAGARMHLAGSPSL